MRGEVIIAIVGISIVLAGAFFIFSTEKFSVTNFVVYSSNLAGSAISNGNSSGNIAATMEDALQAINDCEDIIKEMQAHNFSITYMNDALIEAKRFFSQSNYSYVLGYTNDIKERRGKAFEIYDMLTITQISLEKYEKKGIDMSQPRGFFERTKSAFYEDRYQEAENLLGQTRTSIDSTVSEFSVLKNLERNAASFFKRNWYYILGTLLILAAVIYFGYRKIELDLLKKKIKRMKAGKIALNELMKRAQIGRFKENKISGLIYKIRMKKYQEKISEIEEELPVLEERLKINKKPIKNRK